MRLTLICFCCGNGAGYLYKLAGKLSGLGKEIDINIRNTYGNDNEWTIKHNIDPKSVKDNPVIIIDNDVILAKDWERYNAC
jgi:hypothetical protein